MNDLKVPERQDPYLQALMETDQRTLPERVKLAGAALLFRLKTIQRNLDQQMERQAIEDALNGLIVLKVETANMKSSRSQSFDPNHLHVN